MILKIFLLRTFVDRGSKFTALPSKNPKYPLYTFRILQETLPYCSRKSKFSLKNFGYSNSSTSSSGVLPLFAHRIG